MPTPKRLTIPALALSLSATTALIAAHWMGLPQSFDSDRLRQVEERSEELANRLLEFSVSVRERDLDAVRSHFAPLVEWTVFPNLAAAIENADSLGLSITRCNIAASQLGRPEVLPVDFTLAEWKRLLDVFETVQDARWKVTGADFDTTRPTIRASAAYKFFLVGRDKSGRRLWIKGTGHLRARRQQTWLIDSLQLKTMAIERAEVDLFSEISLAAGVSVPLPRYGQPGNDDFIYHGAAAGDLDGDGYVDLVATGITGLFLFRNLGDGTFEEMAWRAGLPPLSRATAPLLIDIDNDGDQDLFLAAVGAQILLENVSRPGGKLRFVDISIESGVAVNANGFGATAGDINGDGLTDIYVSSYNRYGRVMPDSWHRATNGTANLLLINLGDRRFSERARVWGVDDSRWSYASQMVDFNSDGRLDLYVVNDFGENGLYINRGERFEDGTAAAGLLDPGNGMGVSVGDFNNDARLDVFVTNMSSTAGNRILARLFPDGQGAGVLPKLAAGSMLYAGQPDGSFDNVTAAVGPFPDGWAWGGVLVDLDNDGWQDLYSANGFVSGDSMEDT